MPWLECSFHPVHFSRPSLPIEIKHNVVLRILVNFLSLMVRAYLNRKADFPDLLAFILGRFGFLKA